MVLEPAPKCLIYGILCVSVVVVYIKLSSMNTKSVVDVNCNEQFFNERTDSLQTGKKGI